MSDITARFYQPIFGNDNVYAPDVIDLNAFFAPITRAPSHKSEASAQIRATATARTAKN